MPRKSSILACASIGNTAGLSTSRRPCASCREGLGSLAIRLLIPSPLRHALILSRALAPGRSCDLDSNLADDVFNREATADSFDISPNCTDLCVFKVAMFDF